MNTRINRLYKAAQPRNIGHSLITASFIVSLSACGGSGGDDDNGTLPQNDDSVVDVSDPTNCSAASQKLWAYNSMQDFYLFYDQVPVVDPQSFDTANDLVRSVRFQERDDFSRVTDAERSALQFDAGREFGLGYRWRRDSEDNPRIIEIVPDSPFGRAGVERGDIIRTVDGLDWNDPVLGDGFSDRVFGEPDNPASTQWEIQRRDTGQVETFDFISTEYSINTTPVVTYYTGGGLTTRVGYLVFNRFLETSVDELNNAFSYLSEQNIGELILDLRYNSGGRISVARHLASQIAGESNAGRTIYEYRFNDKYTQNNFILDFASGLGDLNLSRVIILTTDGSASSSEIVVAGLQPHMEVVTIGGRTTGKPYVQYSYDRCGERLAVIEAEGFNAAGVSVFGGVPATCYAADDVTRNFGLGSDGAFEGMLRAGIEYIEDGSCATGPSALGRTSALTSDAADDGRQGFQFDGGAIVEP